MTLQAAKRDIEQKMGQLVHVSEWLEIDQQRIDRFADATNDHQWLHTDPERAAAESPYRTTIAHGFLSLALVSHLRGVLDAAEPPFPGVKAMINYGSNRVRYPTPVRVGARIRGRFQVQQVEEVKGNGLQVTELATVEIDGEDKPACVAELILRLYF